MRALCTDAGLAGLQLRDLPLPEPGAGELRVRVRASAVNPADEKVLSGSFVGGLLHGRQAPLVVGYDLAGPVTAVGPGADLAVGAEVFGFLTYGRATRRGAFAEEAVLPATNVAPLPAGLAPKTACALATAGVTALQSLRDLGRLQAGQRALVIGAAGGVGALAVGVAVRLGAEVTAVCAEGVSDFVRGLGATHIVPRGAPLPESTRFHVILDAPAVSSFSALRARLEPGGTYVTTLPSASALWGMASAPLFGRRSSFVAVKAVRADLETLAAWALDGMAVPIDGEFPVRDARSAIERLSRGGMRGRVVVDVEGGFA